MRRLRKAGAVVLLLLAALLLLGPKAVDWNGLKPALLSRLEAALGRRVEIAGPLSAALLPRPVLLAAGVSLANLEGGDPRPMARLPLVEMRLALLPLLGGRLELSSLRLQSPEIRLETLADGRDNWRFGKAGETATAAASPPSAASASPAGAGPFGLDHLFIDDGRLSYVRPRGAPLALDGVTAELVSTAAGAWRADGTAQFGQRALLFSSAGGSFAGGLAAPFALTLGLAGEPGALHLDGQLAWEGGQPRFNGRLAAKAPGLAPRALALEAAVSLTGDSLDLRSLILSVGDNQARGSVHAGLGGTPAVDITLVASRLDLDGWPAPAPAAVGVPDKAADAPAAAAGWSLPPLAGLPEWLSLSLDLKADLVNWRGGRLRGLKVNLALANGELTVEQVKAELPGQSDAALFGFLSVEGGRPLFDGSFEIAADDLRGLLSWLRLDVSRIAAERLHAGRIAGRVRASPDQIELAEAVVKLDGARLDAAATLKLGARPSLGLSLSGDQLNIDAYRPLPGPAPATDPAAAAGTAPSGGGGFAQGLDVNLKAHAGRLILGGQTADGVGLDATWLNGVLFLHDLSVADLSGASLSLAGEVAGLDGGPAWTVRGLHYELRAARPAPLLQALGLPLAAERWGALAIAGVVDGGADKLTLSTRGEAGGALFSVGGTISDVGAAARIDLAVEASHSSLAAALAMLAPASATAMPAGGAAFAARVSGTAGDMRFDDLRLRAGPLTAAGKARLRLGPKPRIEAELHAGEVPLKAFFARTRDAAGKPAGGGPSPQPVKVVTPELAAPRPVVRTSALTGHWSSALIDLSWLTRLDGALQLDARAVTWDDWRFDGPVLSLALADGVADLSSLTAGLWHGRLAAKGRLAADGAIAVDAELHDIDLSNALLTVGGLHFAEGTGNAQMRFTSSGLSVAEWIGRLGGTGRVVLSDGAVKGFDLKAANERMGNPDNATGLLSLLQSGLTGGVTRIGQLSADLRAKNGILGFDDLDCEADGGTARGTVEINLPAYVMDAHADFRLASASAAPPLVLRLSGPLEAPRRVLDINPLEGWLLAQGLAKGRPGKGPLPPKAPRSP